MPEQKCYQELTIYREVLHLAETYDECLKDGVGDNGADITPRIIRALVPLIIDMHKRLRALEGR